MIDSIVDEEKAKRLAIVMDRQREIQRINYGKQVGSILEVMVEGENEARKQWIGRTSQNKTLNFSAPPAVSPEAGSYHPIKVTGSFPNSLVGEMVA
jgi:tRNA-2-methylthio-N6-dimethylallyladenosine synthase